MPKNNNKVCGFCGRPSAHTTGLNISGRFVEFCEDCLDLCCEIADAYEVTLLAEDEAGLLPAEEIGISPEDLEETEEE